MIFVMLTFTMTNSGCMVLIVELSHFLNVLVGDYPMRSFYDLQDDLCDVDNDLHDGKIDFCDVNHDSYYLQDDLFGVNYDFYDKGLTFVMLTMVMMNPGCRAGWPLQL